MGTNIQKYNKALIAIGGAVVAVAAVLGTSIDPTLVNAIVGAIASILVFVVPNADDKE